MTSLVGVWRSVLTSRLAGYRVATAAWSCYLLVPNDDTTYRHAFIFIMIFMTSKASNVGLMSASGIWTSVLCFMMMIVSDTWLSNCPTLYVYTSWLVHASMYNLWQTLWILYRDDIYSCVIVVCSAAATGVVVCSRTTWSSAPTTACRTRAPRGRIKGGYKT